MFDKRIKKLRIFEALPGWQSIGIDLITPHGPLILAGRGRETWKPSFASTGERGMRCYSVGLGPVFACICWKRRPGHAWTVRAAEALNRGLTRA